MPDFLSYSVCLVTQVVGSYVKLHALVNFLTPKLLAAPKHQTDDLNVGKKIVSKMTFRYINYGTQC